MRRAILPLIAFVTVSTLVQAATVNLLCPDGQIMQQGTSCSPGAGCHRAGVILKIDGNVMRANIDEEGSVKINDAFLNRTVNLRTEDNFWGPDRYCSHFDAGFFVSTFTLRGTQTISTQFEGR